MGLLDRAGGELTARAEDAEILVVNTCSFIDSAKQESVNAILEMAQHKRENGGKARRLIVAGCLVERYRDEIRRNIPEVDAVVGTGELESILEAAGLTAPAAPTESASPFNILVSRAASAVHQHSHPTEVGAQMRTQNNTVILSGVARNASDAVEEPVLSLSKESPHLSSSKVHSNSRPEGDARERSGRFSRAHWDGATAALPEYLYSDATPRILTTPRSSAYIKIAEGCDHPCSFCIIPQLRGKFRSRPLESIVAEAERLIAQGVREITLIGQDTTCYGEDLGLTRRARHAARRAGRAAGAEVAALPLRLSQQGDDAAAGDDGAARDDCEVSRCAVAARIAQRAEADEARRHAGGISAADREGARDCSGNRAAQHVHRRLSRRDGGGLQAALRFCCGGEDRLAGRLRLLGRGGRGGVCARRAR